MCRSTWVDNGAHVVKTNPIISLLLPTVLALLTLFTLQGCDLFATREPEPPVTAGSSFEQPTTPSTVLRNLQSAINFANSLDYRKCFGDSSLGVEPFRFQPSAEGLSVAPGRFVDWTISDEESYIRTIFSELLDGTAASLTLTPSEVTSTPIGDSVRYTADYTITFPHTREGVEREASGRLVFTMKLSTRNEWYITWWQDIAVNNQPTWSLLKARFSN
ncbi:MAG: hypothetical protein AB7H80_16735 [Candidatus Kapaibacterium sp.]